MTSGEGRSATPTVVTVTAAELRHRLVALHAAAFTWQELIDRHSSLDALMDEIDSTEWLLGGESAAASRCLVTGAEHLTDCACRPTDDISGPS